ncbi:MAG: hypothetical protein P8Y78_07410 [Acidihalobacter sp.]
MTMNHNEFFRQATLRICGRLGMDKALYDAKHAGRNRVIGMVGDSKAEVSSAGGNT